MTAEESKAAVLIKRKEKRDGRSKVKLEHSLPLQGGL